MIKDFQNCWWLGERFTSLPYNPAVMTDDYVLSYEELYKKSFIAAGFLKARGITAGSNAGILYSHNYNYYIIINALWILGAVPVPLNVRNTAIEISIQLSNADIKHVVLDETNARNVSSLDNIAKIIFDADNVQSLLTDEHYNIKINADDTALIMFTSGSGGKSKAVVHTFYSLTQSVKLTDSFITLSDNDIFTASLSFYHIGGFMVLVRALLSGGAVSFSSSIKHDDLYNSMKRHKASVVSIVPTTLIRFMESGFTPYEGLRCIFLGGAPASDELIIAAYKAGWPVIKVYSSTETCSMIAGLSVEDIPQKYSSAGKAFKGVFIQIINDEITVKAPSLFKEYYKNREKTNSKIKEGNYYTGDFGRIDDEGFLYIEARREDLIISGGENISPKEVEDAVRQNPCVEDVYIYPMDDNVWGQIPCAAVQVKDNMSITVEELQKFLLFKIAKYKIPKKIFFLEHIPRNEMGKVKRDEIMKFLKDNT